MGVHAEQYVEDGYLVVEGLVEREVVQELHDDVVRFARGEYPLMNPGDLAAELDSEEAALRSVLAIHFPHWVSPVMLRALKHPGVVGVLSEIVGAHLPHWQPAVRCMQSMLFVKPPNLPGQAWHQDERFIATRDRSLVGAWIALDDATVDNGCLWVIPGSHRNGYLWPTRAHEEPDEYDFADQCHGFDESAAVPVEVPQGSVVFFNGYLLHKSLRNRSDRYRRALVNHYCNAWSLLPWMVGEKKVDAAGIGLLHNKATVLVAGEDPHAWRGAIDPPKAAYLRPYQPA